MMMMRMKMKEVIVLEAGRSTYTSRALGKEQSKSDRVAEWLPMIPFPPIPWYAIMALPRVGWMDIMELPSTSPPNTESQSADGWGRRGLVLADHLVLIVECTVPRLRFSVVPPNLSLLSFFVLVCDEPPRRHSPLLAWCFLPATFTYITCPAEPCRAIIGRMFRGLRHSGSSGIHSIVNAPPNAAHQHIIY